MVSDTMKEERLPVLHAVYGCLNVAFLHNITFKLINDNLKNCNIIIKVRNEDSKSIQHTLVGFSHVDYRKQCRQIDISVVLY